jgi:DNA repair exonuclease SbcCD ATPase subunit
MWSALRSDFKELTSSLANDGNQVLQEIEKKLVEKPSGHDRDEDSNEGEYEESPSILMGEDGEVAYVNPSRSAGEDEDSVSSAMQEAIRRMADEETYLEPLLVNEVNGVKTSTLKKEPSVGKVKNDYDLNESLVEDSDQMDDNTENEVGFLLYTDEDDPIVIQFLQNFDIESKTDDIASILDQHADTVKEMFEVLVPVELTYEQFWQRYFFRCDERWIRRSWDAYDERMRKERKEMIDKGKQTVTELFGGALKLVKGIGNQDDVKEGNIFEKYQSELEKKKKAMKVSSTVISATKQKSGETNTLGSFFSAGRPPFVMNTAVDEDSNDYENDDEDQGNDDADSFGWGSDEEEEIEFDEDSAENEEDTESIKGESEQEENDGSNVQELKKELDLTREERDQLHQTVVMLKKELQVASTHSEEVGQDKDEYFKTQLLEKDSEISDLKARLHSIETSSPSTSQEQDLRLHEMSLEIEHLKNELSKKQVAFDEVMVKLDSVVEEEDEKDRTLLQEALETINDLQAELHASKISAEEAIKQLQEKYETEIDSLRRSSSDQAEFHDANESFRSAGDSFSQNMEALESAKLDEIKELHGQLADALSETDSLRSTIEKSKAENQTNKLLSIEAQATITELQSELDSRNADFEEQIKNLTNAHRSEIESLREELSSAQELLNEAELSGSKSSEAIHDFQVEKEQMKQHHTEELEQLQLQLNEKCHSLEVAQERITCLESQRDDVDAIREKDALEKESDIKQMENARDEALKSASKSADELSQVRKVLLGLEGEKAKLEDRIIVLESENAEKLKEISSLSRALEDVRTQLNEKVDPLQIPAKDTRAPPSQVSSFSSTVKVDKADEELNQNPEEEDDDDGWGDDWSDDDA